MQGGLLALTRGSFQSLRRQKSWGAAPLNAAVREKKELERQQNAFPVRRKSRAERGGVLLQRPRKTRILEIARVSYFFLMSPRMRNSEGLKELRAIFDFLCARCRAIFLSPILYRRAKPRRFYATPKTGRRRCGGDQKKRCGAARGGASDAGLGGASKRAERASVVF